MYKTLLTDLTDNIFTVTIHRPDKLNAINEDMARAFARAVNDWIVAEWLDHRTKDNPDNKPPGGIIGRAGKQIKKLLDEGISYETVRQGFAEWDLKGADPSAIPSFINQVQSRRTSVDKPSYSLYSFPEP